jgi:hypothetical protein
VRPVVWRERGNDAIQPRGDRLLRQRVRPRDSPEIFTARNLVFFFCGRLTEGWVAE